MLVSLCLVLYLCTVVYVCMCVSLNVCVCIYIIIIITGVVVLGVFGGMGGECAKRLSLWFLFSEPKQFYIHKRA